MKKPPKTNAGQSAAPDTSRADTAASPPATNGSFDLIAATRRVFARLDAAGYNPLRDRWLWIAAGLISLLCYGYEISSFSLSIDEELHSFQQAATWKAWLTQGRWGMALITYLIPPMGGLPFLPTLLFCVGLSFSAVLFSASLRTDRRAAFVFVALFVSCPIWPHIGEFNTFSSGFVIGLALCAAAALVTYGQGMRGAILAGILLTVSIAIYQTLVLNYMAIVMIVALRGIPEESSSTRSDRSGLQTLLFLPAGIATASLVLYVAISKLALFATGSALTYIQDWLQVSELLTAQNAGRSRMLAKSWALLSGSDPAYLGSGPVVLLLSWMGVAAAIWKLFSFGATSASRRLAEIGVVLGAVALALTPVVLSSGRIPIRALVAFPLVYAVLACGAFLRYRLANAVCWFLIVLAVLTNSWIATSLFYSDTMARQRDAQVAATLIPRVEALGRTKPGSTIRLTMAGTMAYKSSGTFYRVEIFGTSFFEHNGGNIWRVVQYLKLMGLENVSPVGLTEIPASISRIESMPVWPDPESVALIDGVVVVKFGDITDSQRLR
ncbi:MAG: glucosyltransferase domain-containing protein [Thermoanaerobaculia bacterium]|jgi:hypothetical protein